MAGAVLAIGRENARLRQLVVINLVDEDLRVLGSDRARLHAPQSCAGQLAPRRSTSADRVSDR
jgi:hypothetical protein